MAVKLEETLARWINNLPENGVVVSDLVINTESARLQSACADRPCTSVESKQKLLYGCERAFKKLRGLCCVRLHGDSSLVSTSDVTVAPLQLLEKHSTFSPEDHYNADKF